MADHSSMLAWRIPWTEEPGGLQFMGLSWKRVGNWATEHKGTHTHAQLPWTSLFLKILNVIAIQFFLLEWSYKFTLTLRKAFTIHDRADDNCEWSEHHLPDLVSGYLLYNQAGRLSWKSLEMPIETEWLLMLAFFSHEFRLTTFVENGDSQVVQW